MNDETATHVASMATKIENHARHMASLMGDLAHACSIQWQADLLDNATVNGRFSDLARYWQDIEQVLKDMTPRLLELQATESEQDETGDQESERK